MAFQCLSKFAVISTFYSMLTLLLCRITMVQGFQGMAIERFVPWLQAATGFVGSYLILVLAKMLLPTVALFKLPLFFGLPTLCALIYWSHDSKVIRVGIAVLCMVLFIAHPVGLHAASYTLFWLIPMMIAFLPQHMLLTAFGSTFTAHAVGSVMHLYLLNSLSADAWLALVPLVLIERTMLALSSWAGYIVADKLREYYKYLDYSTKFACK